MSTSTIQFEIDDSIAIITLNRPEKLNALGPEMLAEFDGVLDKIEQESAVRAVLLTGSGDRSFCVGADIHAWSALTPVDMWQVWIRRGHRVFGHLAHLRQPVIAVLNGYTFGGGLELAMAADLRIAAAGIELALPEVGLATIPGWGGTRRLAALVGPARAKQMILTGDRVDAATAERWGLVNWVVEREDLISFALQVARRIAANAPLAVQLAKQIIDGGSGDDTVFALEGLAGALSASTEDGREGVQAFREKRPPRFSGR
jgi:enoyl-CoA hydratase